MARYRRISALLLLIMPLAFIGPARSQSASTLVYLPLIARSPIVSVTFASNANQETGELLDPRTEFAAGLDLLWVSVRLEGYAGRVMRLDFTYADGETLAGSNRSITNNDFRYTTAYCITTAFTCDRGRVALPAGPYTARVFVDGQQVYEATATIR
ncbi:MAG: hypothetical protein N2378_02945 [Chloroflexaceae bacterium]|nr:hypothetical protein [Chloroflexaceae bacterium]